MFLHEIFNCRFASNITSGFIFLSFVNVLMANLYHNTICKITFAVMREFVFRGQDPNFSHEINKISKKKSLKTGAIVLLTLNSKSNIYQL